MSGSKLLFQVPIATGGQFDCTQVADRVYLLSFQSPPDNRLTTEFNAAFVAALDFIEHKLPRGVLITTSAIEKFFSNGLDLAAMGTPGLRTKFMSGSFLPLLRRLLVFPMPTVALVNGHAFAGGLIVALHHDYRIQNPRRGYLAMNEIDFGASMAPPLLGIFRAKLASPATWRTLILEGHRFNAEQALQQGLTDGHGGLAETLQFVKERNLVKKAETNVYGQLRQNLYCEQLALVDDAVQSAVYHAAEDAKRLTEWEEGEERLKAWEGRIVSKL